MREHRSRPEPEIALPLVEIGQPGDVARQQVGGELDPAECAAERFCERAGQRRLAHARHILDQHVALGQHCRQQQPGHLPLANQHLVDLVENVPGDLGNRRGVRGTDAESPERSMAMDIPIEPPARNCSSGKQSAVSGMPAEP